MGKKQTYLEEALPTNNTRHLRIVISDVNQNGEYLTVSVDSYVNKFQDSSCIIEIGELPFITHKSFVNYKYAKVVSFQQIYNGIRKGVFLQRKDISEQLLKKIQDGAKTTRHLPNEYKAWFELF